MEAKRADGRVIQWTSPPTARVGQLQREASNPKQSAQSPKSSCVYEARPAPERVQRSKTPMEEYVAAGRALT